MAAHPPQPTATGKKGRRPHVLVMGAGRVGCWLGGRLQAIGAKVYYVGRPRVLQTLYQRGLTLTGGEGRMVALSPDSLRLHDAVPPGVRPHLVLLCVKSGATAEAAAELNATLPPGSLVLSMQHGVSTADMAQHYAPDLVVLRGLVPFMVAEQAPGHLHRTGDAPLCAQTHMGLLPWLPWFNGASLPLQLHTDLLPMQWGQLLLNLNHAVHALSGLPLRAQLLDGNLRACTAAMIGEALQLMRLAGIQPAPPVPVPPALLTKWLRLPSLLFRLAGRSMLRLDAGPVSGIAEDWARQLPTEIEIFQGEVLRLAASLGQLAPVNARMTQLIRSRSPRNPPMTSVSMRKQLGV